MKDDADSEKREGLSLRLKTRDGNWAEWGRVLPFPSPYLTLIYLFVNQLISSGDEKSNLIPVPDRFEYPRSIPIPAVETFFYKKQMYFSAP